MEQDMEHGRPGYKHSATVGDWLTYGIGADRYPCEVVKVTPTQVHVRALQHAPGAKSAWGQVCYGPFEPSPNAPVKVFRAAGVNRFGDVEFRFSKSFYLSFRGAESYSDPHR